MAYKMENEELQIASCGIADLTEEQVQLFTEQWGDGSGIDTLVLFYEKNTGLLVLNRDNEKYEIYKEIAEAFLLTSKSGRRELMKKAPDGMRETLRILDSCIRDRTLIRDVFRAKKGIILDDDLDVLGEIYSRCKDGEFAISLICAFNYGVMQGKRAERLRKKNSKGGAVA